MVTSRLLVRCLVVVVAVGLSAGEARAGSRPKHYIELFDLPAVDGPAPLKNGGFEKGLEGWSRNPNAAADRTVRHEGAQSARLTTTAQNDARDGIIYLSQNRIPVKALARYTLKLHAKMDNVVKATIKGNESTGVTIHVQWTEEREWFAVGASRTGLFGTNDWREITLGATAPYGARYATVFLGLIGHGTVWFDAVSFAESAPGIVLKAPPPDGRLDDNTPEFAWSFFPGVPVEVEVSRSPDFPAGATTVQRTESDRLSLESPIAPGKWFWRVRCAECRRVSESRSFVQTAPAGRDTTGPKITATDQWVGSDELTFSYEDESGTSSHRMLVDGEDATRSVNWGPRSATYRPPRDWPKGLHTVEIEVTDRAGNTSTERIRVTHTDPMPKAVWESAGGVAIDGRKHFPLGIYGVRPEDMKEIAEAGFSLVHMYRWDGSGDNASALAYLDAAARAGLRVFIGLNRDALMRGEAEFVAKRVGALMAHPALFAWYLFDEPGHGHQYCPPTLLAQHYRLVKQLDPFHPVIVTVPGVKAVKELYRDSFDVHWSQTHPAPWKVISQIDTDRTNIGSGRPVCAILHCWDRKQTSTVRAGRAFDPAAYRPNRREMRAQAYTALAHNSSGLIWWWYAKYVKNYVTVAHVPWAWEALTGIVREIRQLRPVLTAEGEPRTWVESPTGGPQVHLWEKRHPGGTVIIAVSTGGTQTHEVSFKPRTLTNGTRLDVLWEDRSVRSTNGTIRDAFEPLAVHVYSAGTLPPAK